VNTRLYFDHCATTPVHPAVRDAMLPALEGVFGNPSSMHSYGFTAKSGIEGARETTARGIGASGEEIFFTSGATEATNLALIGGANALPAEKKHIITSNIEHHATLHTAETLAAKGFEVTFLPVDQKGIISIESVETAVRPETGLISIMMVNNEVGSVQDIAAIGKIARRHGIVFHTDAVQAINYFEIDVDLLGVDLLSLSAHKIYGPKGIGALYRRKGTPILPLMQGGAQESGLRPGTENVPGIFGLGAAMALRNENHSQHAEYCQTKHQELIQVLKGVSPGCIINGPAEQAAPHILSVSFPNANGELLLFHLNQLGVSVSMGSACTSQSIEPSHVLQAMGLPEKQIDGTLRVSIGWQTTIDEIHELGNILSDILPEAFIEG